MLSNRTENSRTSSPASFQSSSEEDDQRKTASRNAKDRYIWKKTNSTKSTSSPAQSISPRRNTETQTGINSDPKNTTQTKRSTRGNDEKGNHQSNKNGRDTTGAGDGRYRASAATVDTCKAIRLQNLEPKFEPRFALYKSNAMTDEVKREKAYYYEHRHKVDKVKPVVDNRPPTFYPHIYCNMKKLRFEQDRQDVIEKENKLLLGKLVTAMTTTRVDNWNPVVDSSKQKHRKQNTRIETENRKMNERIENRKSTGAATTSSCISGDRDRPNQRQQKKPKESCIVLK